MNFELSAADAFNVIAQAPARVNLMGEHTDYNQGLVLPTILPLQTTVQVHVNGRSPGLVTINSETYQETIQRQIQATVIAHWSDYVIACLQQLQQKGFRLPALEITIASDIPVGQGLSSSAALEIALLRALRELLALPLSDFALARLAHQAEYEGVGVPCGLMDQMVCGLGQPQYAFYLDTQNLSFEHIPLPDAFTFVVIDSGTSHQLIHSSYQQRRQECEQAAQQLQVKSLRQVDLGQLEAAIASTEPLHRRAKHVITENQRVIAGVQALHSGDIQTFGRLMNESHHSQKVWFEVTVPETDSLCDTAVAQGALGARQTGGGFGGAIVALLPPGAITAWWQKVAANCPTARLLTHYPVSG